MSQSDIPLRGNRLIDRLFELESVKHEARLKFDPARLASDGVGDASDVSRERIARLAELTKRNAALLLNLISISPHFALAGQEYTSRGSAAQQPRGRVRVEG